MRKKRVLLAGGAGFIGSALAPHLAANQFDVTVVDAFWFGNHLPGDIPFVKKDLFDLQIDEVRDFDAMVFLGGLSNDPMAEFAPRENFIYNAALPAYLGFVAREAGLRRFVYAGSSSVYGYTHNKTFTEEDAAICNYPYGASKLQGEVSVMSLQMEDFSPICLRQGTICGYSPRMRFDLAINTMFKNAISKQHIELSNHRIWRPIFGIVDVCEAYRLALESPLELSGVFNVASFNITVGEMAETVKQIVEENFNKEVTITDKNIQDYRNYKVSWQKASDQLGYQPTQTIQTIVQSLIDHLPSYPDFDKAEYYNIETFKSVVMKMNNLPTT